MEDQQWVLSCPNTTVLPLSHPHPVIEKASPSSSSSYKTTRTRPTLSTLSLSLSRMEDHRSPFLSLGYVFPAENMEELKHSLICSSMELEQTKMAVEEELRKRDTELNQLKYLLNQAIKERDEANDNCQKLLLENLFFHRRHHTPPLSATSDEPRRGIDSTNGFSSSDCEESIVSSPATDPSPPLMSFKEGDFVSDKPLPEKGKLLQAVMKAGPLLQTLLLAGPLPQWRHPPPPLDAIEIPPITISSPPPQLLNSDFLPSFNGCNNGDGPNRKRVLLESTESPTEKKYPRAR